MKGKYDYTKNIETELIKLRQEFNFEAKEHQEYIAKTETERTKTIKAKKYNSG